MQTVWFTSAAAFFCFVFSCGICGARSVRVPPVSGNSCEDVLLSQYERGVLSGEMRRLMIDVAEARGKVAKMPDVVKAKKVYDETEKNKAAGKQERAAALAAYREAYDKGMKSIPDIPEKLRRLESVGRQLEWDKKRNLEKIGKLPPETVNTMRPELSIAGPVYGLSSETNSVQEESDSSDEKQAADINRHIIKIFITSEHKIFLDGRALTETEASAALEKAYSHNPDAEIVVDGEIGTPISAMAKMVSSAKKAGFENVRIAPDASAKEL